VLAGVIIEALLIGFLLLERRRRNSADRAARSSEGLSRAILSSLSARIAILNSKGEIIRVSENWGKAAKEEDRFPQVPIGASYLDSWHDWDGSAEVGPGVAAAVEAVLEGHEKARVIDYPIRIEDQHCWVEVRVERLDRLEGGAVVTHVDVTAQKQLEMDRRRSIDELHHMNRVASVGQLAGSLAHELAQPLASIMSNAQAATRFARRPQPDIEEVCEALEEITAEDRRARSIIDRLRAILKKEPIPIGEMDLNVTVREVSLLIRNILLMRSVSMRTDLAEGGVMVEADQISLQQVLLNLLNNAIDAMGNLPAESRLLTVTTRVYQGAGEIVVDDSGPGIPDHIKDRLFDSFFTTKPEGLGMGLSICRSIVEALHGRISVEQRTEGGARFRVTVPLAGANLRAKSQAATLSKVASPGQVLT
jgi:C4-dicarboxylate-specific signal transduction histidine kinase